jgi:FdhD protein
MRGIVELVLTSVEGGVPSSRVTSRIDHVAQEEPLEIQVTFTEGGARRTKSIAITMRTPGDDAELAVGFLYNEGIVTRAGQISCVTVAPEGASVVSVELTSDVTVDLARLERHFFTTSSCGVCGKTSLDALRIRTAPVAGAGMSIAPDVVHGLPRALRDAQSVFGCTGGLHAAAFFDTRGALIALREDVGRHNALDKLVGAELRAGRMPVGETLLLVSGRASFELVQKASVAGVPVMVAIGAPSSLAVTLAEESQMTLIGFARDGRFNVYTRASRVAV